MISNNTVENYFEPYEFHDRENAHYLMFTDFYKIINGKLLIVSGGGILRDYDLNTGKLLYTCPLYTEYDKNEVYQNELLDININSESNVVAIFKEKDGAIKRYKYHIPTYKESVSKGYRNLTASEKKAYYI